MRSLAVAIVLLATGCDGTLDASDRDALADGPDAAPYCGDERGPGAGVVLPVVNGAPGWDPDVVDLDAGQALAVGALMQRDHDGRWSNMCTATLVAPRIVLTAAHCVRGVAGDLPASSLRFAVGDDVSAPLHSFRPEQVISHPDYTGGWDGDDESDVAVLVLPEPASSAVAGIVPIAVNCTPLEGLSFVGRYVQNVGYGVTQAGPHPPDNTRKWWTVEEVVALSAFDFIVDGHGVSSVCGGDSGGPSLWTLPDGVIRVVGTVSWGDPDCVSEDHFTRVDDCCDFIGGFLDPCGDVGWEGTCRGDDAVWCEDGVIRVRNCADCDQRCGWVEEMDAYYCIDPT